MRRILTALCIFAGTSVCAAQAGTNDHLREVVDAKRIVEQAYVRSKMYCAMYPYSEHMITVRIIDQNVTITVKCEVVNAYLASHPGIEER